MANPVFMLHVRCYILFMRRKIRVIDVCGPVCGLDYLFGGIARRANISLFIIKF